MSVLSQGIRYGLTWPRLTYRVLKMAGKVMPLMTAGALKFGVSGAFELLPFGMYRVNV